MEVRWLAAGPMCAQCRGEAFLKVESSLLDRSIEEIILYEDSARIIGVDAGDVAVLERAISEGKLLGALIDQQRAFHECAAVETAEIDSASEVERARMKRFAPEDTLLA